MNNYVQTGDNHFFAVANKTKKKLFKTKRFFEKKAEQEDNEAEEKPVIERYTITISTIDGTSDVIYDNEIRGTTPCSLMFEKGIHDVVLVRPGYPDQSVRVHAVRDGEMVYRHVNTVIPFKQIGIFSCGMLPKQVLFTPDNKKIYIPLLEGDGFQIFDVERLEMAEYTVIPDPDKMMGFAEGLFIEEKEVFWVSQMTKGLIYEYSIADNTFRRIIKTGGAWSKFMDYSDTLHVGVISNWNSNDISIIDFEKGVAVKRIKTGRAPRGVAFSNDDVALYVTSFDGGKIHKFDTQTWNEARPAIYKKNACMRHIALENDDKTMYVSNMLHNEVYTIDTDTFTITKTYKVYYNPNTIQLTPDQRYLFISSRGPNNTGGYLLRSPKSGCVTVIDIENEIVKAVIPGGNQPTGLAISSDNRYMCFSNFKDNNIELYWLGDL